MMKFRGYIASTLLAASAALTAAPAHADKATVLAAKAAKAEARKEAETGSFSLFNPTATGRNKVNAYLLSYLALMVYPQNLSAALGADAGARVRGEELQPPRRVHPDDSLC